MIKLLLLLGYGVQILGPDFHSGTESLLISFESERFWMDFMFSEIGVCLR